MTNDNAYFLTFSLSNLLRGKMRRAGLIALGVIALVITALPDDCEAASRTSIGIVGGGGAPLGWWGDRWGTFHSGEVNVRYEFSPGTGLLLLAGLHKTYLAEMSAQEIAGESTARDLPPEFQPYAAILNAQQGGAFKQLPLGFGLYREGLLVGCRAYASLAFAVHLWKFERSQEFSERVTPPMSDTLMHTDIWSDKQDGAKIGLQMALGALYPLRPGVFVDASVAYHFVDIGSKYGSIAYYGFPARTWTPQKQATAKGRADFLLFRVGFRFGQ